MPRTVVRSNVGLSHRYCNNAVCPSIKTALLHRPCQRSQHNRPPPRNPPPELLHGCFRRSHIIVYNKESGHLHQHHFFCHLRRTYIRHHSGWPVRRSQLKAAWCKNIWRRMWVRSLHALVELKGNTGHAHRNRPRTHMATRHRNATTCPCRKLLPRAARCCPYGIRISTLHTHAEPWQPRGASGIWLVNAIHEHPPKQLRVQSIPRDVGGRGTTRAFEVGTWKIVCGALSQGTVRITFAHTEDVRNAAHAVDMGHLNGAMIQESICTCTFMTPYGGARKTFLTIICRTPNDFPTGLVYLMPRHLLLGLSAPCLWLIYHAILVALSRLLPTSIYPLHTLGAFTDTNTPGPHDSLLTTSICPGTNHSLAPTNSG